MKYYILTRNIEELKDVLKDYPLSKEASSELHRLNNSDLYAGPEPAHVIFENDTYVVINRYHAHLKPAHCSNIILVI